MKLPESIVIRFIPKSTDDRDPVVRLRCNMIVEALCQRGINIGYYKESEWADILVIGSTEFSRWLTRIEENRSKGQIVVLDLPENEFRRTARINRKKIKGFFQYVYNPLEVFHRLKAHKKRKAFDVSLEKMVRLSDHITVCSEDTLSHVSDYNANCSIIYEPLDNNYPTTPKAHNGTARHIVWIGMQSNLKYVLKIDGTLNRVMERTGVRLKVITSPLIFDYYPRLKNNKTIAIDFVPWNLNTLWDELSDADIGIAPVFDYIWKSPNKVTTYWAAGLPVVASPCPTYSKLIVNNADGFIASDLHQWRSFLLRLIYDANLRNTLGKNGYEKAVNNFSLEQVSEKWLLLFEELQEKYRR